MENEILEMLKGDDTSFELALSLLENEEIRNQYPYDDVIDCLNKRGMYWLIKNHHKIDRIKKLYRSEEISTFTRPLKPREYRIFCGSGMMDQLREVFKKDLDNNK